MGQISGSGMMHGNLHAVVWTGASSSLHQTKAEWLISRKLSVTLTGKVGQATAVACGSLQRKEPTDRGRLEGPEARAGSQICSSRSSLLVQDRGCWETVQEWLQ